MSEFSIDINKTKNTANSMSRLKSDLNSCAHKVNSAKNQLKHNVDSGLSIINVRLNEVSDSIIKEALRAESLASALTQIVMKYNAAETAICGSADGIIGKDSEEKKDAEKSWWEKLVDWIKGLFGIKEEPLSVSREAEKEHDLYMQSEIFNILGLERFSKSTWKNASIEERKKILNEFMTEIALVMGISISGNVVFEQMEKPTTRGGYYQNENKVHINTDYLSRSDSYQIMQTMIHEMRHAYQKAAVDHPEQFNVSAETIAQWRENFKPEVYYSGDDYQRYVSQPIEYDAKNFAKQYSDLFGANPEYRGSW